MTQYFLGVAQLQDAQKKKKYFIWARSSSTQEKKSWHHLIYRQQYTLHAANSRFIKENAETSIVVSMEISHENRPFL
jgi:hypothetical protein